MASKPAGGAESTLDTTVTNASSLEGPVETVETVEMSEPEMEEAELEEDEEEEEEEEVEGEGEGYGAFFIFLRTGVAPLILDGASQDRVELVESGKWLDAVANPFVPYLLLQSLHLLRARMPLPSLG